MSLKSFLKSIGTFFKKIFNGLTPIAKEAIHIGVIITENLKKFVESGTADVLTSIIPGDLDDKIKERLRKELPVILVKLKLAEQCSNETEPDKLVLCAIKVLQSIEGDFKKDFYDALAVQIGLVYADGKVTWDELKYVIKWFYDNKFKPETSNND